MMSGARFNQVWSGTSAIARKVYEAVPIEDMWNAKQVLSELIRRGIRQQVDVVAGCLDTLRRSGLVREADGKFQRVPVRETKKVIKARGLDNLKEAIKEAEAPPPPPTVLAVDTVSSIGAGNVGALSTGPLAPPIFSIHGLTVTAEGDLTLPLKKGTLTMNKTPPPTLSVVDRIGALSQKLAAMAERHKSEMCDLAHEIADVAIDVQGDLEKNDADLAKFHQLQSLLKGI